MQTYALNLTGAASRIFPATADLFVYESGTNGPDGELRIIVKPDNGGEITLRPGQRFRLPPGEKASQWMVRAFDGTAPIVGAVIIGSGEFDDANTMNKFTLDASLANNVTVKNTDAERVPVALDPQDILNTSEPIMSYTNSKNVGLIVSSNTILVSAAENQNGVIIEQLWASTSAATTQINANGGLEMLEILYPEASNPGKPVRRRTKVRPGVSVTGYCNSPCTVFILYTLL